jgi:hypothetical protein
MDGLHGNVPISEKRKAKLMLENEKNETILEKNG